MVVRSSLWSMAQKGCTELKSSSSISIAATALSLGNTSAFFPTLPNFASKRSSRYSTNS